MNSLLLATAMAVAPAPAAPTHDVLAGESLSRIAQCELGDANRWTELLELNQDQITDPNIIEPGWVLVLPEGASGDCPAEPVVRAASTQAAAPPVGDRTVASTKKAPVKAKAKAQPRAVRSASSGGGLESIKACESGGNYGAVSSNGKYRGAYQFDQQTWESVGGNGDPAAASPAEQDQRAAALQQKRGNSPWPSCG